MQIPSRRATAIIVLMCLGPTPAWAAGTQAAATTVLVVFGAVVLAGLALAVASIMWMRGRRFRHDVADERATLDEVIGAAEDLLATAEDGYLIWPLGGDRAAASEKLGRMFRLDPVLIAGVESLETAFEVEDFAVFRRAVGALRSDGIAFDLTLQRVKQGAPVRTRGGLAASGAAVVWFRDLSDIETLQAAHETSLAAAAGEADSLRALLDTAPYPVWRRGPDLSVTWANRAYCDAVEAPLADVLQRSIELVPGLTHGDARALAKAARESGETRSERRRFVVAGDRRTFELVETPMSDGDIAGYARDVTDRDDAAGDLARHLNAQTEVLNQVRSAIAIFGPDRRLVFFNLAFVQLWRLDADWLATGPDHAEILEKLRDTRRLPEQADFPAYKAAMMDLYTSLLERHEDQLHLPDGTTLRVVISLHPLGGLLFIYEDVSDRLELERARNTLALVQRATLDHLFEGVAVFGPDGKLKLFNPGYARLWALDEAALDGEPHVSDVAEAARDLFVARDRQDDEWAAMKDAVIRGTLDRKPGVGLIERPDGSVLRHAAVPLPDGAMLHTYLDVSDSTRMERALRERAEALEEAGNLKSEFVGNMSYELRTPLSSIIGFAEILANEYHGDLNDHQRKSVEDILASAGHLMALIDDILDLATIDAGYMDLEIAEVDIAASLDAAVKLFAPRARRSNISVVRECDGAVGTFMADERRIKQILYDLLSNAAVSSASDSEVRVGARRTGGVMELWVSDDGKGIPHNEPNRVFDAFAADGQAGRSGGSGLGLALVKRLVEMHGGSVALETGEGSGTTVICRLPLDASSVGGELKQPLN